MAELSLPAPGARVGNYVLERECGQGGSSWVFKAHHAVLGSTHAVKMLLPTLAKNRNLRARLIQEGRIQANLRHPNIVNVTDVVDEAEVLALAMDFVEGETLDERLRAQPASAVEGWRDIFLPVLLAIDFAHGRGVVHRDLKPANIVLDRVNGATVPKVLDFGIAKAMQEPSTAETRTGTSLGTPRYMSPEQIENAKEVDARSDIFSLGALLYELCTGAPAFAGSSDYQVMSKIIRGQFDPPRSLRPDLSPAVAAAVQRALSHDPAMRFHCCRRGMRDHHRLVRAFSCELRGLPAPPLRDCDVP